MSYYDYSDGGAGASKARNKLAAFLRGHGIDVYGNPPDDQAFLSAIQKWADAKVRNSNKQVRREEQEIAKARINAMRPPIAPRDLTWKERFSGKVSQPKETGTQI